MWRQFTFGPIYLSPQRASVTHDEWTAFGHNLKKQTPSAQSSTQLLFYVLSLNSHFSGVDLRTGAL